MKMIRHGDGRMDMPAVEAPPDLAAEIPSRRIVQHRVTPVHTDGQEVDRVRITWQPVGDSRRAHGGDFRVRRELSIRRLQLAFGIRSISVRRFLFVGRLCETAGRRLTETPYNLSVSPRRAKPARLEPQQQHTHEREQQHPVPSRKPLCKDGATHLEDRPDSWRESSHHDSAGTETTRISSVPSPVTAGEETTASRGE